MRWGDGMIRRRVLPALAALLLVLAAPQAEAQRLATQRSLNDKPHGLRMVTDPVRAGKRAQRFEVRPGDCGSDPGWSDCATDRERSEVSVKRRFRHGTDQWFGFSVWLPPDFRTSSRVNTSVGQIHQTGGPSGKSGGFPSFPPLLQLEMRGDLYYAKVSILTGSATDVTERDRDFPLASISAMRGRWTDIIMHLDTSKGQQVLEVYVDGTRKAAIRDFINFIPKEYYFKYGIYRSFVSRHGGPMPTQVVVIDEVKMGKTRDAVTVNPAKPVD